MITPAMLEGSAELRGAEYKILGRLHGKLSDTEYQKIKLWPLALEMRMNKATVGRAMRRLVELGYLKEKRREDGAKIYMLVANRY